MATFKTTHVGSLPRPQEMNTKLLRKENITKEEIRNYLKGILEKQLSLGIDYINNGELPRDDYVSATVGRISGFNSSGTAPIPKDMEEVPEYARRFGGRNGLITLNPKAPVKLPACAGPLSYTGEASVRAELDMMADVYEELKLKCPNQKTELFFTSPSPGTVALFMENQHYPNYEAYLEQISIVLKQEYDIVASYGFHLQVDCPDLAMGRHTGFKHLSDEAFVKIMDMNVHYLNQALSSVEARKCRAHICWGNYAGTHHCDIDLKKIYHSLMRLKTRYISIEASNHRHSHEWTVFDENPFPDDKVLLPGVIDTASNIVEHPDLVAQRILKFAKLLGPDRVVGSTDCGFATTASATSVSGGIAWLKLSALVEGAKRASEQLK